MNNRRKLLLALGASALASPLSSLAQRPAEMKRIGFLGSATAQGYARPLDALRAGLRDLCARIEAAGIDLRMSAPFAWVARLRIQARQSL